MFTIAEVMNTDLFTLGPEDSVADARQLMAEHHIRHIPIVTDGNRLVGLVSQRDVLAAADSSLVVAPEDVDTEESHIEVSSIMSVSVNTIDENASLRGAAIYLQKHKIGCLPVVKGELLVGIITDSDFVAVAINLMETLEEQEPAEGEFFEEDFEEPLNPSELGLDETDRAADAGAP
jgi:CBS domain-containing protein